MSLFTLFAIVITVVALLGYVNRKWLRLPPAVGLTGLAFAASQVLALVGHVRPDVLRGAESLTRAVDLDSTLLNGMLGYLLFAGSMTLDLNVLRRQWRIVSVLAVVGTILSTVIVGALTWWVLRLLGQPLPLVACLLFGALISPTDPVSVLSVLKSLGVNADLEAQIAGESLFNDGVGIVLYTLLAGLASTPHGSPVRDAVGLFLVQTGGGALLGFVSGWIVYRMLRSIDDYRVEVPLTVALVTGGFALAQALHVSGPIAMVVAGLLIGNKGRALGMSETTRLRLDQFWELLDDMLNAILFVLIGLDVLAVRFSPAGLVAAVAAIAIVLFARSVSAGLPAMAFRLDREAIVALVWGGVRGGIAIALALGLTSQLPPETAARISSMTYAVVTFSILVQAPTLQPLMRRSMSFHLGRRRPG